MNAKKKETGFLLLAFLTPGILYTLVWYLLGGYPFGERNILMWDLNQQYVDFFQYFKNLLQGSAHLGYSFSKGLGGSNVGLFSYYLGSPLNLLVIFFEDIRLFCVILTILKFSFCGLTSYLYFGKHFQKLSYGEVYLLSQAYALMAYNVLQMNNVMWIDGVIMLPLLLWAIDRYLQKKQGTFLAVSVALVILFNWYSAYMSIAYASCYFIVMFFLQKKHRKFVEYVRAYLDYAMYVVLGMGMSAVLFVPTLLSLMSGKGSEFMSELVLGFRDDGWHIIRGNVIGTLGNSNQLNLFCSSLFFVLALVVYFRKEVEIKRRITYFAASLLLVFSAIFLPTDCVWNGFRYAASYYCRYSFVIILTILLLAGLCMEKVQSTPGKQLWKSFLIPLAVIVAGLILNYATDREGMPMVFVTGVFMAAECGLFLLFCGTQTGTKKRVLGGILTAVVLTELSLNMYECHKVMYTASNRDYQAYSQEVLANLQTIQNDVGDSKFYRVEKTEHRLDCSMSESMAYNYHSVGHYSSTLEQNVADTIYQMGYVQSNRMPFYRNPILPMDSLMGVQYVMSSFPIAGEEKIAENIYKNPYALSLGFFAPQTVRKAKLDANNPFEYQNQIFSALIGKRTELYERVDCRTVEQAKWEVEANPEDVIYGYIQMKGKRQVNLKINGQERGKYSVWNAIKIFGLDFSGSNVATVELTGEYEDSTVFEPMIYRLKTEVFRQAIEQLRAGQMDLEQVEDGEIKGQYTAGQDGYVLITVPFDEGWKVSVNGERTSYKEALGCFLAVPVSEGENKIEMHYQVRGLKKSVIVSVVSLILTIALWYAVRKREERKAA